MPDAERPPPPPRAAPPRASVGLRRPAQVRFREGGSTSGAKIRTRMPLLEHRPTESTRPDDRASAMAATGSEPPARQRRPAHPARRSAPRCPARPRHPSPPGAPGRPSPRPPSAGSVISSGTSFTTTPSLSVVPMSSISPTSSLGPVAATVVVLDVVPAQDVLAVAPASPTPTAGRGRRATPRRRTGLPARRRAAIHLEGNRPRRTTSRSCRAHAGDEAGGHGLCAWTGHPQRARAHRCLAPRMVLLHSCGHVIGGWMDTEFPPLLTFTSRRILWSRVGQSSGVHGRRAGGA